MDINHSTVRVMVGLGSVLVCAIMTANGSIWYKNSLLKIFLYKRWYTLG